MVFLIKLKDVANAHNFKINIIKALREFSDPVYDAEYGGNRPSVGLKDAVDMYQALAAGEHIPFEKDVDTIPDLMYHEYLHNASHVPRTRPYNLQCSVYREGVHLNLIQAIKDLRHACGYGLKESKDLIDHMKNFGTPVKIVITDREIRSLREFGFTVVEPYRIILEDYLFTD